MIKCKIKTKQKDLCFYEYKCYGSHAKKKQCGNSYYLNSKFSKNRFYNNMNNFFIQWFNREIGGYDLTVGSLCYFLKIKRLPLPKSAVILLILVCLILRFFKNFITILLSLNYSSFSVKLSGDLYAFLKNIPIFKI